MKKIDKIKIIVLAIGAPFIVGGFILSLILTMIPKEEIQIIQKNEFIQTLNNYKCNIIDMSDNNEKVDVYYMTEDSCPYNISYIVFNDNDYRNELYSKFVNETNSNSNITGNSNTRINIMNKFYYERTTHGDYYKSVKLNKNTILYVSTIKENRDIVIEIEKELGYYYEPNWDNLKLLIFPFITALIISIIIIIITFKEGKYNKNPN